MNLGYGGRLSPEPAEWNTLMRKALHAAIHVHDGAGDHLGLRRGHEGYEIADIVWFSKLRGRDVLCSKGELVLNCRVATRVLL